MPIDYIGYYENIAADFANIASMLGKNVALPHHNSVKAKRSSKPYQAYYDDETREIVASVYKRDIELLGYDFDTNISRSRFHTPGDVARMRDSFQRPSS
jgi:hypothetical protein